VGPRSRAHRSEGPRHLPQPSRDRARPSRPVDSSYERMARFPVRIKHAMLPWITLRESLRARERGGEDAQDAAATTEEARG